MKKKLKPSVAQQMVLDAGLEDKDLMVWRVHTTNFLNEILEGNPTMWMMVQPINIFQRIIGMVAERASELNDPIMNGLMARLTLYEVTDPSSPDYDQEITTRLLIDGVKARKEIIKQKRSHEKDSETPEGV